MPKQTFTPEQSIRLAETFQHLLLEGVLAARPWANGELKFQGGTCLHLAYGSPRFSEDLDFVMATPAGINRIVRDAAARVRHRLAGHIPGLRVDVSARDDDDEQSPRNPRAHMVTFMVDGPNGWARSVKVKLEFWVATTAAVQAYATELRDATIPLAPAGRSPITVFAAPVIVECATLQEILVDKVHAIGAREYLKPRDFYDVWWLGLQGVKLAHAELMAKLQERTEMYPNSPGPKELVDSVRGRCDEIKALASEGGVHRDFVRWLGSEALSSDHASHIVDAACSALTSMAAAPAPARPRGRR